MSVFLDSSELYSVMEELWRRIKADEGMSANFSPVKLIRPLCISKPRWRANNRRKRWRRNREYMPDSAT